MEGMDGTIEESLTNDSVGVINEGYCGGILISKLSYYYTLLCVIIGITGNCMVWVLIRSNRTLRKLPSNIYLLTLAVMSSFFLLTLFGYVINIKVSSFCKAFVFMGAFSDFASVWLIVLVCFERLILLYGTARTMTTSKAKYHVAVVLIVAFVFNSWIFITAEPGENGCDINLDYVNLYTFMGLAEAILMIIPTVIIVVSNVLVVIRLQTHLRRMPTSPTVSFSTADLVLNNNHSMVPATVKSNETIVKSGFSRFNSHISITTSSKRKKRKNLRYADVQLTRSLLVITSVFVALNLPTYLVRIYGLFLSSILPIAYPIMDCLSYGSVLLLYTHHAILFYLYIFWSPQMKRRLVPTALKLLECYCFKFPGDTST